ncbi:MAG: methyltransferase domain-containing protein [Gemmataceae bacterium]
MDSATPRQLRIWPGGPPEGRPASVFAHAASGLAGPHNPADLARQLYVREALNPWEVGPRPDESISPYTLPWFVEIENQRHGRRGRWLPRLLEFTKHCGETLLGVGTGLGTDWLQYARHGAHVTICCPSAGQLALIRRNFELRGLSGRFIHTPADALPLENASIDVVCINGLLHEVEDPQHVVKELFRVLKPGGKVLAVTPAYYNVDYFLATCFPWHRWLKHRPRTGREADSQFTAWKLRRLFAAFVEPRFYKRQLRRGEVPHIWRFVPLPILERLMGRILVIKAFKPVSAITMNLPAAA